MLEPLHLYLPQEKTMPVRLLGSPASAAHQLIAHLRTQPGCEGLFPERDHVPTPSPGQSDQQHLPGHPRMTEIQQPETASHSTSLEARVDDRPR